MQRLLFLFICLGAGFQFCVGQSTSKKEFYSKDFNWRITIPENFQTMDPREMASMQNKGAAIMDKANNTKVENHAITLFSFKTDQMNHFDCSYQPFNPAVDGDFVETWQAVNNMIYKTFTTQLQGVKVDTAISVEKISNLEFHTFKANVEYPNKMVMHLMTCSRLFDKKEFTVNIVYKDEATGQQMLTAWMSSTFGK
jgi:hypothetical protein